MRYERRQLLKRGLGVETWLGVDGSDHVVIKQASEEPGAWMRLAHEAEVLGQLSHPRIPRLRWLGREEGRLTLVADYVPGPTLEERLREGPMDAVETARLARSLLEVLGEAHERGLLHRDLKPSNLIWREGRLWVIDWGLSRSPWLHAALRDLPVGTVHYLAPEMAGTLRRDVAATADLYAVGVVLHRCLTGRVPYTAPTVSEVLRMHLGAPLPEVDAPPPLAALVRELLAKDPADRPPDAGAALDTLEGRPRARPTLLKLPPLVGRDEELSRLRRALRRPCLLVLEGEAGSGKSRLLEALGREAAEAGWRVLRGQALSRLESVPLQLFAGPFFELAQEGDPALTERLRPHAPVLTRVAPALSGWLGGRPSESELGPAPVLSALSALLEALAEQGPCLFLLDDAQWADSLSLEFLARVASPPVSLILATRDCPPELESLERLRLGPLEESFCRELVADLEPAARQWLLSHAQGNPFLLVEGLRGMGQTSRRSGALLSSRLESLPPETRRALEAASALGREFPLEVLEQLSSGARAALGPARQAGLLWAAPSGTSYTFAHDRVRETLYETLPAERRRALHARAAEALPEAPPAVLAHHYARADDPARAYPHARAAAEQARRRFDFGTAELFYRLCLRHRPGDGELLEGLAESLAFSHRQAESLAAYQALLERSSSPVERARILVKMGDIKQCLNRLAEAERYFTVALVELGESIPSLPIALGSLARLAWNRWAPRLGGDKRLRRLKMDAYRGLGEVLSHGGKLPRAFCTLAAVSELAMREPEPDRLSREISAQTAAALSLFEPLAGVARRVADRLVEEVALEPDRWHRARLLCRLAVALATFRRPDEVVSMFDEAIPVLMECGDLHEVHASSLMRLALLYHSGRLARAGEEGRRLYWFFTLGDSEEGRSGALWHIACGSGGEVPFAWLMAECRRPPLENPVAECVLRTTVGLWLLRQGRPLEAARRLARPTGAQFPLIAMGLRSWEATAWRLAAHDPDLPAWQRRLFMRRARRAARVVLRGPWPLTRPHALRELALGAAWRGRYRLAERLLADSLEQGCSRGLHLEVAWTELEREKLRRQRGLAHGVAACERRLRELGAGSLCEPPLPPAAPAAADLFRETLRWGRRLASTLEEPRVYAVLGEAARAVLGCDTCRLVSTAVAPRAENRLVAALPVEGGPHLELTRRGRPFDEEDERRVEFLVRLAGAAIDNARLLAERERTRHERLEAGRRFEALFEAAGVGLAVLDESGAIARANPWLGAALGVTVGRSLASLVVAADHGKLRRLLTRGAAELRFVRPDHTRLWGRCTLTRLDNRSVLSVLDVTHRRMEELARFLEDERRLLSSELHDVVAGDLAAVHILLQNPAVDLEGVLGNVRRLREQAERLAGRSPTMSEGLEEMAHRFGRETGIETRLALPEGGIGDELAAIFCLRIVQEALTNVRRHARARTVSIEVRAVEGGIEGSIQDDGIGFEPGSIPAIGPKHYGLRGFLMRAEMLGGQAEVTSRPGGGTRVSFILPLTKND